MTQLNTPYPSTAYLTGFLRSRGFDALQEDLALALVLRLLSRDGLKAMRSHAEALPAPRRSESVAGFLEHFERYLATIEPTIAFLQGRDSTLAHRICSGAFLPEGPRFDTLDAYVDPDGGDHWAGPSARSGCMTAPGIWPRSTSTTSPTCCARRSIRVSSSCATPNRWRSASRVSNPRAGTGCDAEPCRPDAAWADPGGLAAPCAAGGAGIGPVSGCGLAAFRIAQSVKAHDPHIVTVLGGGYVNTELRELAEPRVFDYFDYVTLDDGERPCSPCSSICAASARASGWYALSCAMPTAVRCATSIWSNPTCLCRGRHADLGRAAAAALPVAARHAQSDAPAVVGRALEQAHRSPRLLLEEVQLLRREPRLHLALRRRYSGAAGRPHRGNHCRDRADRLSLRG